MPITPMGSATMMMPTIMQTPARNRPTHVTGTTSPYPTVVIVTTAHHIAFGILQHRNSHTTWLKIAHEQRAAVTLTGYLLNGFWSKHKHVTTSGGCVALAGFVKLKAEV